MLITKKIISRRGGNAMQNNSLYITVKEVQQFYLPISIKKIRKILTDNVPIFRAGNKILVNREALEEFLKNNAQGVRQEKNLAKQAQ